MAGILFAQVTLQFHQKCQRVLHATVQGMMWNVERSFLHWKEECKLCTHYEMPEMARKHIL